MTTRQEKPEAPLQDKEQIAARALAEAKERRAAIDARTEETKDEVNGRGGLDPARFGDWEIKGIASDF